MGIRKLLVFHTRIEVYRVDFFNNLANCFDMHVVIDDKYMYESLSGNISHLYRFSFEEFNSEYGLFHTIKYVINQLNTHCPDVVLVSECGIVSLIVVIYKYILGRSFKIVSTIDDSYSQLADNNHFTKRHEIAERILIPFLSDIINVEPRSTEYFRRKYNKGLFFPIIRDEDCYRQELKKALSISRKYVAHYNIKNKKIVLFVGRFVEPKNVICLINVIRSLHKNDVCLVLVGAGPEEIKYREMTNDIDVIYTGRLTGQSLYAWYNIADVFVLPSIIEPFGAVVNEALIAGCQCVVSEKAGSSCLIREGVNGYVINPMDENKITQIINSILGNNRSPNLEEIRHNLMPYTFKEKFRDLVNNL